MISHIKINLLLLAVSLAPLTFLRTQHLASNKVSLCEATATYYSKIMAICYLNSQLQHYIDSNPSLSKAEDWAAVDLNAFSLI